MNSRYRLSVARTTKRFLFDCANWACPLKKESRIAFGLVCFECLWQESFLDDDVVVFARRGVIPASRTALAWKIGGAKNRQIRFTPVGDTLDKSR